MLVVCASKSLPSYTEIGFKSSGSHLSSDWFKMVHYEETVLLNATNGIQ